MTKLHPIRAAAWHAVTTITRATSEGLRRIHRTALDREFAARTGTDPIVFRAARAQIDRGELRARRIGGE